MRHALYLVVGLLLVWAHPVTAQQAPSPRTHPAAYAAWKQARTAPPMSYLRTGPRASSATAAGASASGFVLPFDRNDPSYSVLPANDDDYTDEIPLGFTFSFYGTPFTSLYVNNNGNVSFDEEYYDYDPVGFPSSDYKMLAAFWADVDTRGTGSGLVYYKTETAPNGSKRFIAVWDNVGYYNSEDDKLNSFQLVISDGNDPALGAGNNVCYGYGDMAWTTGSASDGFGGFGGYPATVGANKGDGATYFQYGRFDKPGSDYDGPDGSTDGVDALDGQQICFNTGASTTNIAPIVQNVPSGPVSGTVGTPLSLTIDALSPESNQTTTFAPQSGTLPPGVTLSTTAGTTASATFSGTPTTAGTFTVVMAATDNGSPALTTTATLTFNIAPATPAQKISPVLESVVANCNGTYTAFFGYENRNATSVTIPAGSDNRFSPLPADRGQTTTFLPGRQRNAFSVVFSGPGNLVWTLRSPNGQQATSTAGTNVPPAQNCACQAPVAPSYAGGYVLNAAQSRAFVRVDVPEGATSVRFYNTSNLIVGTPETDAESGTAVTFDARSGDTFTFSANPTTLFFPISAAGSGSRVAFYLEVSDACGQTVDVDPAFTLRAGEGDAAWTLDAAAPSPVVSTATIRFSLAASAPVRLAVYDVLGREVSRLVDATLPEGDHHAVLDASALPSGLYVYRLTAGEHTLQRTLTITR